MSGAILSFTAMAVAGRAVQQELDTFELMLYRSVIGVGIVLAISSLLGTRDTIRWRRMGLHAARNVSHFFGQNCWFLAITLAPLAQVIALEFTSPLWIVLLAPLVLGERLTRGRLLSVLGGLAGVFLVAQPWVEPPGPGLVFAAAAAVGFAGSALFTKLLVRTESLTAILFWLTIMQSVFGLALAAADGEIAWPSLAIGWAVLAVSVTGLAAHTCLTSALRLAPASVVMPLDFLRLPLIALVGVALYGEALDAWVVIGAVVIVAANWANLRLEARGTVTAG